MSLDERAHARGVRLEVEVQFLRGGSQPGSGVYPMAPGEVHVLVGLERREEEVLRRAAQHPKPVDQPPEKPVGSSQLPRLRGLQDAARGHGIQRLVDPRSAQSAVRLPVDHLEHLHGVLQVDGAPGLNFAFRLPGRTFSFTWRSRSSLSSPGSMARAA